MPSVNAENPVPGNAIGATEYPSDMLKQADELQRIWDRPQRKLKVVNSKGFRSPTMQASPNTSRDVTGIVNTESFTRNSLRLVESKKSKYKSLKPKVKEVDSPGFLPSIWRGDPAAGMMNNIGFQDSGMSTYS